MAAPPPAKHQATEDARAPEGLLVGMTALIQAYDYLNGPADVLSASLGCRRWRELATSDVVWRGKFEREGMRAKAARWGVALPSGAEEGGVSGGESSGSAAFHAMVVRNTNLCATNPLLQDPHVLLRCLAITTAAAVAAEQGQVTMAVYRQIFVLKVRACRVVF